MGLFGKSFNEETDIPSLTGKVFFVTGANIGLGKANVLALAKHKPDHIYLSARNESKAQAAISDIKAIVPDANITFIECDLASLSSVAKAAADFKAQAQRLDVLILNAGVMALGPGLTSDGYEIQFGTNHVGHALLTKLLLPVLESTASSGADVRIVVLSSDGHSRAPKGGIDFKTLKTDLKDAMTFTRYGQSKLANILYAEALAKRYPNIKSISVHPGYVNTNLTETIKKTWFLGSCLTFVLKPILVTPQKGAWNQLWAATSPDAVSGEYYVPVGATGSGSPLTNNEKLSDELWDWTQKELEAYN